MAIVARNEYNHPVRVPGSSNRNEIPAGSVIVLSEDEWSKVPFDMRGIGKLRGVYPNELLGENARMKLDYYQPGGSSYYVRFKGVAVQDADDSDTVWTVQRMSHSTFGGEYKITEVQILEGVAWSNRASLPWS